MKKLRNYSMIMRTLVNLASVIISILLYLGMNQLLPNRFAMVFGLTAFIYIFFIANYILTYHLDDQSNS